MQKVQHETYYNNYIERDSREFRLTCVISGESIPESEISSINIEYDLVSGAGEYTIGNLSAAKLTLVISNNVKRVYETNDIELTVELKARSMAGLEIWIPVSLGRFYVFEVSSTNLSRTITAYDDLYKTQLEQTYESTLTYPNTVWRILDEICPLLDISYDYDSIPNETVNRPEVVTETVFNDGKYEVVVSESNQVGLQMKVGQMLMYLASYLGGNFIISGSDTLKLIKYPKDITKTLGSNRYAVPTIGVASYSMGKIDCTTYPKNVISVGYNEDASSMKLENPFMDRTRLLTILDNLSAIKYNQARVKIKGDPRLELGDLIEIVNMDSDGNITSKQLIPILRMSFHYSGGCTNDIESPCKPIAEKTINYKGTLTSRLDTLESSVSTIESMSQGIYESVSALKTVKDYVDDMNTFVEALRYETVSENQHNQYRSIFEKINSSNAKFNEEYDEIYNNKYLQ